MRFAPAVIFFRCPEMPRSGVPRLKKEFRLAVRRGKDVSKLQAVMRRECHVEPDWLLVYKRESGVVIFERTGTHAVLFE
jgi:addiction module RelE/StbE family toxin